MLLYKTKSFYNIGLSYKLLRLQIVDLTFRFFFLNANFMTLRTRTRASKTWTRTRKLGTRTRTRTKGKVYNTVYISTYIQGTVLTIHF